MQTTTDTRNDDLIEFAHLYQELTPADKLTMNCVICRSAWSLCFHKRTYEAFRFAVDSTRVLVIGYACELYGAKVGAGLLWATFAALAMFTLANALR